MDHEDSFLSRHVFLAMVLGILLALLGIVVMTSQPTIIAIVMGVALIVSGVSTLQTALSFAVWTGYFRMFTLLKGIICIALGIWGIANANRSFELVMYLMGAQMVIGGILSIVNTYLLGKHNEQSVGGVFSDGVFSLILAAVLFAAPRAVGHTILIVIGVLMVVLGVSLFVWGIKVRKINRAFSTDAASAEVIEEKDVDGGEQ